MLLLNYFATERGYLSRTDFAQPWKDSHTALWNLNTAYSYFSDCAHKLAVCLSYSFSLRLHHASNIKCHCLNFSNVTRAQIPSSKYQRVPCLRHVPCTLSLPPPSRYSSLHQSPRLAIGRAARGPFWVPGLGAFHNYQPPKSPQSPVKLPPNHSNQ